ncbi:hypothetical protein GTNG_0919 [Geobacillus thermodenitrificans NG80-2]|uniref:Uncharacterized protein n=1 Tax=Geobacillus thermodenitrificans (strain NG80-2) TaxID=420246 RepID=A4ILU3_GEOTN|nr:hypothetical protein GTNG_0919 [Geobacillus thermodenitrificans NG80-2]
MFFIAKSKKQMADVPMICTILVEFGIFHFAKVGKEAVGKEGLSLQRLGDQFFSEQIFPLLKQLFFQLFHIFHHSLLFIVLILQRK